MIHSKSKVHLGLCCINNKLRTQKPSIFPNRTCRLSTAESKGIEYVKQLALANLTDVLKILEWNKNNNIFSYRMSSDMFPHCSNPRFGYESRYRNRYSLEFARPLLTQIGKKAKEYGIRLSFHPGQYNQVASPTQQVFRNTIRDLSVHARILDLIEAGEDWGENRGIIRIHGGGIYNNKSKTIQTWIQRFKQLPEHVQSRIALENCEKCYSAQDCLVICNTLCIPLIFDVHHYNCYDILHPEEKQMSPEELIPNILKTWSDRRLKPYFHISEQGKGRTGHHSDYVEHIPKYILELDVDITLDIEAKAKENAILHLLNKYKLY